MPVGFARILQGYFTGIGTVSPCASDTVLKGMYKQIILLTWFNLNPSMDK